MFLSTTSKDTVLSAIGEVLCTGKDPAAVFNRLRGTLNESSTTTQYDLNIFFTGTDYSGRDFSGIDLTNFIIASVNFTGTNLSSANFDNALIERSNFTNANLKFSNFTVAVLDQSIVDGADFDGASIAKDIEWDKLEGTAKNVIVNHVTFDKKALSKVLESRSSVSYSIPVSPEQLSEANSLAKVLKAVLEKLHTFSGMRKKGW